MLDTTLRDLFAAKVRENDLVVNPLKSGKERDSLSAMKPIRQRKHIIYFSNMSVIKPF